MNDFTKVIFWINIKIYNFLNNKMLNIKTYFCNISATIALRRCSSKKFFYKTFQTFTANHLYWRSVTLLWKRLRQRCFLWILWNFWEHLICRTPLNDYFWKKKQKNKSNQSFIKPIKNACKSFTFQCRFSGFRFTSKNKPFTIIY